MDVNGAIAPPIFAPVSWFNVAVRRNGFLLALPLIVACNGGNQNSGTTGSTSPSTASSPGTISFTLGPTTSSSDTTQSAEALSCEQRVQAYTQALTQAWPQALTHGGLSLAVRTGDCPPFAAAVGQAEPGTPLQADHAMGAGGLSKALMDAAFLTLVDETKIDVYDPVSKHLTDVSDRTVTVRDLLNHSKALADYTLEAPLLTQVKQAPTQAVTTAQLLAPVQGKTVEGAAKLEQILLGHSNEIAIDAIAQALSQKDTPTFIQEKLLTPMSVSDLYIWGASQEPPKIAPGWMEKDGQTIRRDQLVPITYQGASAGLRATPAALANWLEALAQAKSPLSPSSLAYMMRRTSFDSKAAEQQGYGLKIWTLKPGIDAFGQDGMSVGYASLAMTVPTQKVTVVIMTNNESQRAALLSAFDAVFKAALLPWQPDAGLPRVSLKDAPPFIPG